MSKDSQSNIKIGISSKQNVIQAETIYNISNTSQTFNQKWKNVTKEGILETIKTLGPIPAIFVEICRALFNI